MDEKIAYILGGRISKEDLSSFLVDHPEKFDEIVNIAVAENNHLSWRAAWMLNTSIKKNDIRVIKHVSKIVSSIEGKEDGHQRELLKILDMMDIQEDEEGYLFDACIAIWQDIQKSSSVRITAFKIIVDMLKKYPELKNEIMPLTQLHFTETLSPGINNTFKRLLTEITV